jgi:hypothetical protein
MAESQCCVTEITGQGLEGFLRARDFLLDHREDHEAAYCDFRSPNPVIWRRRAEDLASDSARSNAWSERKLAPSTSATRAGPSGHGFHAGRRGTRLAPEVARLRAALQANHRPMESETEQPAVLVN